MIRSSGNDNSGIEGKKHSADVSGSIETSNKLDCWGVMV